MSQPYPNSLRRPAVRQTASEHTDAQSGWRPYVQSFDPIAMTVALLTQKSLSVLVQLGGEDLDRHDAIQRRLVTTKDDAEPTPADLIGVSKSGRTQFRDDG
jgi:hypothetical protein